MDTFTIHYCFTLKNNEKKKFSLEIDSQRIELINNIPDKLPSWTLLDFYKCPHCPLSTNTHSHCPLCANIVTVVEQFEGVKSFDELQLEVVTEDKVIFQETTAQRAIGKYVFYEDNEEHKIWFQNFEEYYNAIAPKY